MHTVPGRAVHGETTVHKGWYGGFVGEFDIPIENPATSWEARLKFKRNVFDLKVILILVCTRSPINDTGPMHLLVYDKML